LCACIIILIIIFILVDLVSIDYAAPDLEDASRARIEMLVDAFHHKQSDSQISKKVEIASKYVLFVCVCVCVCVFWLLI